MSFNNRTKKNHLEEWCALELIVRVNRSAWDHRLSPNPHALTIYLEFVPACGTMPKRCEKC